jgi:hypothetical protein
MAFNDFKRVEQVLQKYPLQIKRERFLPDVRLELPALFMENLDFALKRQAQKKARCFSARVTFSLFYNRLGNVTPN